MPNPCGYRPFTGPWTLGPLVPGSAVKVSVAELNLRAGPCTAAEKRATLKRNRVMVVSNEPFGPFKANGLAWYFVWFAPNSYPFGTLPALPNSPFPDGTDTTGGWIAAGDGSTPYVAAMAPRCPTTEDLVNVVGMLPAEWLACFDGPITIEGTFGCGGCGGTGGPRAEPSWLADPFEFDQIRVRWGDQFEYRPIGLHFPPTGQAKPPEGSIIRATVHVDDPAAQSCSFDYGLENPPFAEPTKIAILWCRERFVVESYSIIGVDSKYP